MSRPAGTLADQAHGSAMPLSVQSARRALAVPGGDGVRAESPGALSLADSGERPARQG